ncbi:MAG: hypothetical protein ACLRZH_16160 [Ruthenibacterium lactatiformans]
MMYLRREKTPILMTGAVLAVTILSGHGLRAVLIAAAMSADLLFVRRRTCRSSG